MKSTHTYLAFFLLICCNNFFAQSQEKPITLETKNGNIEGTLLCPASKQKTPLVVIISGSGPTDRNGNNPMMTNNSLKMLAEGLSTKGIASVRYDKRGIGESKSAIIQEDSLRFEDYVNDAKAWIDLLKKDSRFSEIIIIGHSEGSLIGMIAAQKEGVSKFVSLEGAGITAGNIIREQLKDQPLVILNQVTPIIESLEKGETVKNVPPMLNSLFRSSVQPYLISWFQYNPQKEIAKLNKPVLIVQGTTDIQVGIENADKLLEASTEGKKVIFEGMNHILKEADADHQKNIKTYTNPDLPLKEGLVDSITSFIQGN